MVKGVLLGALGPPVLGALVGLFFGMPSLDLWAKPGLEGAMIGAIYAGLLLSLPGAILGAIIGAWRKRP